MPSAIEQRLQRRGTYAGFVCSQGDNRRHQPSSVSDVDDQRVRLLLGRVVSGSNMAFIMHF
jgi:hypothetical protein